MSSLASVEAPGREGAVIRDGDDFFCRWDYNNVTLRVARLRETATGLTGEATVEQSPLGLLAFGSLTLTSFSSRESLTKKLHARTKAVPGGGPPWSEMMEGACYRLVEAVRAARPSVALDPQEAAPVTLLLPPFCPVQLPTILHGDGDAGKSLFSQAMALAVASGQALPGVGQPTRQVPVMILDFEADREAYNARLDGLIRGLGLPYAGNIWHRAMDGRSLLDEIDVVRRECLRYEVGFVILDNLGSASASTGSDFWHQMAAVVYGFLRSLPGVTSLVIAHQSGAEAGKSTGPVRPFGGVYARNLSRQEWAVRRSDDDETTGHLTMSLTNHKYNYGRRHPPMGLRFEFAPDGAITLRPYDLRDEPDLLGRTSLAFRLQQILRDGAQEVEALADVTKEKPDNVRRTLNRLSDRGKVIRLDDVRAGKAGRQAGRWGLVSPRGPADA